MKSDSERHRSNSEEVGRTAEGMKLLVSGCLSESIKPEAVRESADEDDCFTECHLNEETLKVIHDAERGIGLSGPFDSVEQMLNSLLKEDED